MEVANSINNATNNAIAYMENHMAYNPMLVFGVVIIIIIIIIIISLGMSDQNESFEYDSTSLSNKYTRIFFILFIIIAALFVTWYFYNTNIIYNSNSNTSDKKHDNKENDNKQDDNKEYVSAVPVIKFKKQVFNIPGNQYTYDNATALCKAYGSKLANYEQVEDAYENGGEWCNYGWSEGQMALFPTQQSTFDRLQTIKGHEHDCGRPGVNGGYIANPNVRFGVNCYGYKPRINEEEQQMMKNVSPYPQTMEDIEMEKKVGFWKNKVDNILVSPFNRERWGEL